MRQLKRQLYTIGYSGHTLETFIQELQARHITLLLDIRMTPISRKKGFSKAALAQAVESAGISYCHIRALGSPKKLRQQLYLERDYEEFFTAFRAYLDLQIDSLQYAAELASKKLVCLMCVEECPDVCHRSLVAEAIVQTLGNGTSIRHLPPPKSLRKRAKTMKAGLSPLVEEKVDRIAQ
jgi:uncharacterized protein (DUF488 family)